MQSDALLFTGFTASAPPIVTFKHLEADTLPAHGLEVGLILSSPRRPGYSIGHMGMW